MQYFTSKLAHTYREFPPLFELDHDVGGFEVIDADNIAESVLSFIRKDVSGKQLICVFNMAPIERHQFTIGVPLSGTYTEVLNTEMSVFGGNWKSHNADQKTQKGLWKTYEQTLSFTLPALGAVIWQLLEDETGETKALSNKTYELLSSDYLTDKQWAVLAPYFPVGSRSKYDKRELVNAVLFIQQTGSPWTRLPDTFPPYKTVYAFYKRATKLGIWQRAMSEYEALNDNNCVDH